MTKQQRAIGIYNAAHAEGVTDRAEIINRIVKSSLESGSYIEFSTAGTYYAKAKKAAGAKAPTKKTIELLGKFDKLTKGGAGITQFDTPSLKALRTSLNAALEDVMQQHGLRFRIGNMRYGDTEFKTTLTVTVDATDKQGKDIAAANDWELHCWRSNLKVEDFGKEFTTPGRGDVFVITGYNKRAKRGGYPVKAVNKSTGGKYKFSAEDIKEYLGTYG